MRRAWLGRFSFTFLIIGMYLAWVALQASEGREGPVSNARIMLYLVASMLSFVMGFIGVRERHKRE